MKKMEDIMELLTDEINGFQKSIGKLETLSKNLDEVKVKADTSNIEYRLKEHLRNQERTQSRNQQRLNEINKKLERAKLIPKWLLTIFISVLIILSMTIGYLSFQLVQLNEKEVALDKKEEVVLKGQK